MQKSSLVNLEAVEMFVANRSARPVRRILIIALLAVATTLGPTILLPVAFDEGWQGVKAYVRAEPWGSLWLPLCVAAALVIASTVTEFRRAARDTTRIARRIERDWRWLTERSWVMRTVLLGVFMGAFVGFPIGTLLAMDARPAEIPEVGGRLGIVLAFFAMTLVWTVPAAFWIRFKAVREYRPLLRNGH
jgi:hypothetical protein